MSCLQHLRVSDVMTMDVRNELLSQPVVDGAFTRDPFLPSDPKVGVRFSPKQLHYTFRF